MEEELVVKQVLLIRKTLPKLGGRKLHHMLQNFMEQHRINMGRDQLFDLLSEQGLLIKKRKRRVSTTNSNHRFRKYPNMTKGLEINRSEQLWVSDITYLSTRQGFVYLSLITDAYSKKIVGYNVENNLATEGCIKALQMALEGRKQRKRLLIHHSDRGIQYCSSAYVELLQSKSVTISMTEKGDPHENAIAERVNGILKDEFNLYQTFRSISHAKSVVKQSVFYYNNHRPHGTCDYLTPQKTEMKEGVLTRRWKNYYRRLNTENE